MPGFLVGVGKAGDVAERSPAVISANLKEDMLLQKKLVVLNRSERSVVHQIKVDQKVMYKRFQARLTCSKLAHARLMGETKLQMQLRAKTLGTLNTDIAGNSDEDYVFLEKLEQRPCTSNSFSPRGEYKPPLWKQLEDAKTTSVAEKSPKSILSVKKRRSSSARATYREKNKTEDTPKRKESHVDKVTGERVHKLRPATTIGTRVENEFNRRQRDMAVQEASSTDGSEKKEESGADISESLSSARTDTKEEDNTDDSGDKRTDNSDVNDDSGKNKQNVAFLEHLDFSDARPKTVADITQWNTSIPTSPTSPKQMSRRSSKAADFFQAEEKVDMVALRLQEAKTLDFTDHVNKFCEELEELKCSSTRPDVDYYSMRLQMSLDQANSKSLIEVPGTPEDENARSMGNIFVKSLTLPPIHFYTDQT